MCLYASQYTREWYFISSSSRITLKKHTSVAVDIVPQTSIGILCAIVEACDCCDSCCIFFCWHGSSCERNNKTLCNTSIVHLTPDSTHCKKKYK